MGNERQSQLLQELISVTSEIPLMWAEGGDRPFERLVCDYQAGKRDYQLWDEGGEISLEGGGKILISPPGRKRWSRRTLGNFFELVQQSRISVEEQVLEQLIRDFKVVAAQVRQKEEAERAQEEERKRIAKIQDQRRSLRQCIQCGRPLGFIDKLAGRVLHKTCSRSAQDVLHI